jgi:hypothetical protein
VAHQHAKKLGHARYSKGSICAFLWLADLSSSLLEHEDRNARIEVAKSRETRILALRSLTLIYDWCKVLDELMHLGGSSANLWRLNYYRVRILSCSLLNVHAAFFRQTSLRAHRIRYLPGTRGHKTLYRSFEASQIERASSSRERTQACNEGLLSENFAILPLLHITRQASFLVRSLNIGNIR